jgi:hypothetical protein
VKKKPRNTGDSPRCDYPDVEQTLDALIGDRERALAMLRRNVRS